MNTDYSKQVMEHYKAVESVAWDLLIVAKRLCPGDWVLQIEPNLSNDQKHEHIYLAVVSNGDDNVAGSGKTIAEALAQLIYYMLQGHVFPLTGNGGQYLHPLDRGYELEVNP